MTYYNRTNTCERIKEDENLCGNEFHDKAYREKNKDGNWTGKWICRKCWYDVDYKKRPDNFVNITIRNTSDRRTGNQDPNSSNAKGDNFQELTCIWLDVDDLNIKNDDYRSPIDHSRHPKFGVIQTNGRFYDSYNQYWLLGTRRSINKDFDSLIFYCASEDGQIIERVYIFPNIEIKKRTTITVVKNPRDLPWYEKYRVKDEDTIKKVNDIWKKIIDN